MTRPAAGFPIRLLALDIDGTLVGDDLILRDRTRAAVVAAVQRGVHVSLATGRMASSALVFARELGLRDPIVAYQGALVRAMPVVDGRIGRLLSHRPLAAPVAREAIVWSRAHGLDPHVNHLERFIIRADDPRAEDYSAFLGSRAELVPDIVAAIQRPVTKVIAVGDEPRAATLLEPARKRFGDRAGITISHPRFLEFVAPGISKGRAVRLLARRWGIPSSQVLAIGDQLNDLEMVGGSGHGAAMAHAPFEVRAAARYVAPPVDEEGAARLIEALVLERPRVARANAERLAAETVALLEAERRRLTPDRRPA
ncbi:MAG TPA: Cof-type HAD-IIB family hydrolase [Candidatus Limnocylindrales bacterium]